MNKSLKIVILVLSTLLSVQSFSVSAASIARPSVSGYAGGMYKSSVPSVAANGASYNISGVTTVAGTALNLAGTIPLAANAAEFALTAARANPAMLAGSLLLSFLIANGINTDSNYNFYKTNPAMAPNGYGYCTYKTTGSAYPSNYYKAGSCANNGCVNDCVSPYALAASSVCGSTNPYSCSSASTPKPADTKTAATDADFKALPNPIPTITPELPNAPYLPSGVPVDPPSYTPADVPTSSPYKAPNGATLQPRATVSPNPSNPGTVTIQTYDLPVTNPDGSPAVNPTPTSTTDPAKTSDQCADHPDSLGCSSLDQPSDETLTTKDISSSIVPVTVGSAGTCPAPVTFSYLGKQFSMSFQPACDSANMLRPLILAIAWMFSGIIFVGGVKNG